MTTRKREEEKRIGIPDKANLGRKNYDVLTKNRERGLEVSDSMYQTIAIESSYLPMTNMELCLAFDNLFDKLRTTRNPDAWEYISSNLIESLVKIH